MSDDIPTRHRLQWPVGIPMPLGVDYDEQSTKVQKGDSGSEFAGHTIVTSESCAGRWPTPRPFESHAASPCIHAAARHMRLPKSKPLRILFDASWEHSHKPGWFEYLGVYLAALRG
jgi:hypothetical protein